ncbi:MAG: 30S ribosomal protein S3 [Planctomycetes bacterium]|nr:30S ribosomal protein S3 [Planctomycetota bacterium]
MGQKVHPIGFRVGITEGWRSRWFAPKAAYAEFLIEDQVIRRFVDERLNRQPPFAGLARVEIERTRDEVRVQLHTARPGLVIGPKGSEVDKLKESLEDLTDRKITLNIAEIKVPDGDAKLIAEAIAEQLKKRGSFRRVMKTWMEAAMAAGAKGIKIMVAGRLGGSEMSRRNWMRDGRVPLQTLRADIDYARAEAGTTYGRIGVKVWIYKGDVLVDEKPEATDVYVSD